MPRSIAIGVEAVGDVRQRVGERERPALEVIVPGLEARQFQEVADQVRDRRHDPRPRSMNSRWTAGSSTGTGEDEVEVAGAGRSAASAARGRPSRRTSARSVSRRAKVGELALGLRAVR